MQPALLLDQSRRRRCQAGFARRRDARILKVGCDPPAVHVLQFRCPTRASSSAAERQCAIQARCWAEVGVVM
jgi:hypothetical protein